LKDYSV